MLGENIRRLREERKLTQEKLAEKLEVSFQAVSAWEREEYRPDVDKLLKLAEVFDVSLSTLVSDRNDFVLSDKAIFNWEHMKSFVKTTAKNHHMTNTSKALDYALKAHGDQKRKNSDIPYIYHPLNMACHLLAMGIREDEIIAAALLHDVIEDCHKSLNDLPVNEETRELVKLMTHEKDDDHRTEILEDYYGRLMKNAAAALIKCVDRCNNLTTMSWGLSRERIFRMIKETREYVLPLLKEVRKEPEYNDAAWLLQYQMESLLDVYERLL